MKKITFALIFVFVSIAVFAQNDTLNYMDANGKKQGHWIQKYPNGKNKFEGYFKNDIPIGQVKKYHDNGVLKYDMYYSPNDHNKVKVTMFDVEGTLSARGTYYAKKKDSIWTYYGNGDKVIMEESYNHGKLDGKSVIYWQTQQNQPMEIKYWKDSLKHGDWLWFYENGQIRQKAKFIEDKLNGEFLVYFSDGKPHITGAYKNNVRNGKWIYYKEDGTIKITIEYSNGKILNEDEFERAQTKIIDEEILNQQGKHTDPQDFIDNPESYIFGEQTPQEQAPARKNKNKKEKSIK